MRKVFHGKVNPHLQFEYVGEHDGLSQYRVFDFLEFNEVDRIDISQYADEHYAEELFETRRNDGKT